MSASTLHHIGCSGGKDSSALLLWAIHESGLPRESLRVTFCDTHNEPPPTPQWPPWTPVNTPPTEPGYYLAQWQSGVIWGAHYNGTSWNVLTDDIVAWMPLPPAYVPPPPRDPKEEALVEWTLTEFALDTDAPAAFRAGWDAAISWITENPK